MCILLKTPPESDERFQSYEQLKDFQNNKKQKKFIPFFSGYISQSMCSRLPTDTATLCPVLRLDVMSLPVDRVFQARYHETLT